MNKLTATDALRLSIPERIQLVEDIWDTIASQAEALEWGQGLAGRQGRSH